MSGQFFFGYGSLVNRRTHGFGQAAPARLTGWRRVWRSTRLRDAAFLSAHPVTGGQIDGLVAEVPAGDWPGLDAREAAYRRHDVTDAVSHGAPALRVQVYSVDPELAREPCDGMIFLSYLDTVAEGFHDTGGPTALASFFDSTDGWARPVLNDRERPHYSRATRPGAAVRRLVDGHLSRLPVTVLQPE